MDDIGFLGQNHPGYSDAGVPQVVNGAVQPKPEQSEHEHHGKQQEPDLMNRVAPVKDEPRRHRHGERGQTGNVPGQDAIEPHYQPDGSNTD